MKDPPAASAQIECLRAIEQWLNQEANDDYRLLINRAVFSTANRMGVHPHDLAQYILIRTASL